MTEPAPVTQSDHQPSDQPQKPRTARFGVFEVDFRSGELRRCGVRVKLQEQPFRILAMLLERPGEVVSRDELRERLWPTEFVDFDHSLNTAVRKLRTALDDAAENPRFIETLARRGYRFIAPVVWEGAATTAVAAPVPVPAPSRRLPILPAIVALLVVAAIAAWLIVRNPFRPSVPTVNAIAVLPLANSDPNSQHISDGLTEILIDTLSHLSDLRVMGRSTVFRYRADTDPRTVGKDLNVGAVITGRVQPESGGYRIHVELIDARDGSQLWGNQYRSAGSELAGTQSRISSDLAVELRRGLDREQRQLLFRRYTRSAEAYDLYLQGLYAWNKRSTADLQKAIELFTRAAELDPQFAAPWSGVANTYGVMVGYGILEPSVGTPKIFAAARRALELDPYNGEAYVSMATTEYRNEWNFAAAERDYKRGLTLNPNYATGHQWYSDFLRSMGKFDEAQREIETAARLDPLSGPINSVVCWSLVNSRRYRDAIAFY
jgi:DNA-binding winged helix-turn-helix (wHTH) protein/TolB-like protein